MRKLLFGIIILLTLLGIGAYFALRDTDRPVINVPSQGKLTQTITTTPTAASGKILSVPYINEAPSGNWSGPWKNACEEASIAMVEFYYQDRTSVTIAEAEIFMMMLFQKQDAKYGNNLNSNGEQFKYLIDNFTGFKNLKIILF